jgi:hypothetical protein
VITVRRVAALGLPAGVLDVESALRSVSSSIDRSNSTPARVG